MKKNTLSTHILDTALGRPASGVLCVIGRKQQDGCHFPTLAEGVTNDDGRVKEWSAAFELEPGIYRMRFATQAYFENQETQGFYPHVDVHFEVRGQGEHYHIPLLLSPYGFSTYRGS